MTPNLNSITDSIKLTLLEKSSSTVAETFEPSLEIEKEIVSKKVENINVQKPRKSNKKITKQPSSTSNDEEIALPIVSSLTNEKPKSTAPLASSRNEQCFLEGHPLAGK